MTVSIDLHQLLYGIGLGDGRIVPSVSGKKDKVFYIIFNALNAPPVKYNIGEDGEVVIVDGRYDMVPIKLSPTDSTYRSDLIFKIRSSFALKHPVEYDEQEIEVMKNAVYTQFDVPAINGQVNKILETGINPLEEEYLNQEKEIVSLDATKIKSVQDINVAHGHILELCRSILDSDDEVLRECKGIQHFLTKQEEEV